MTDFDDAVKGSTTRWIVSLLVAAIFGLAAVIWGSLTGELHEVVLQHADLQRDVKDVQLSIQDLKVRVTNLGGRVDECDELRKK